MKKKKSFEFDGVLNLKLNGGGWSLRIWRSWRRRILKLNLELVGVLMKFLNLNLKSWGWRRRRWWSWSWRIWIWRRRSWRICWRRRICWWTWWWRKFWRRRRRCWRSRRVKFVEEGVFEFDEVFVFELVIVGVGVLLDEVVGVFDGEEEIDGVDEFVLVFVGVFVGVAEFVDEKEGVADFEGISLSFSIFEENFEGEEEKEKEAVKLKIKLFEEVSDEEGEEVFEEVFVFVFVKEEEEVGEFDFIEEFDGVFVEEVDGVLLELFEGEGVEEGEGVSVLDFVGKELEFERVLMSWCFRWCFVLKELENLKEKSSMGDRWVAEGEIDEVSEEVADGELVTVFLELLKVFDSCTSSLMEKLMEFDLVGVGDGNPCPKIVNSLLSSFCWILNYKFHLKS